MTRLLGTLRRAFGPLNGVMAPALRAGGGALISNPLTGYLLVLRSRGRRTGLWREAPLGYVMVDGAIYCCAGFGTSTGWYLNVVADPAVEVVLPGRTLAARATVVTDAGEWLRAYRALIPSLGIVGRVTVGDPRRIDDATLLASHTSIPIVRIVPTSFVPGPMDPGGRFWVVPLAASLTGALAAAIFGRVARRLPGREAVAPA
jgi:deazaflavin-dependent oxidoreductase (nitroreductase family)